MHVVGTTKARYLLYSERVGETSASPNYGTIPKTEAFAEILEGYSELLSANCPTGTTWRPCASWTKSSSWQRLGRLSNYKKEHKWMCDWTIGMSHTSVQQNSRNYRYKQWRGITICDWFWSVGRTRHYKSSRRRRTIAESHYVGAYGLNKCQSKRN